MQARRDIVLLEENQLGQDYILADLHGNSVLLAQALAKLQPHDRLFLLGDLTDRGHDSKGVMRKLLTHMTTNPQQVYVVVGNHETSCQDALTALPHFTDELRQIVTATDLHDWKDAIKVRQPVRQEVYDIQFALANGGEWLIDLYHQELMGNILNSNTSLIKRIHDFLHRIPYVIYVSGKRPFICAHADLHLTDDDILTRHKLTDAEINYITNARLPRSAEDLNDPTFEPIKVPHPRTALSTIVYVGHFITIYGETPVIRASTNMVNADSAAYKTYATLLINHTAAQCEILATKKFDTQFTPQAIILRQHCQTVQSHLTNEEIRYRHIGNADAEDSCSELEPPKRVRNNNASPLQQNTLLKRPKSLEPTATTGEDLTFTYK